jgi:predicted dinucleotide-binding enzyme
VTYVIVGAGAIGGTLGHHLRAAQLGIAELEAGAAMSEQRIADLAGALR